MIRHLYRTDHLWRLAILLIGWSLGGCESTVAINDGGCAVGQSRECACANGHSGWQTCSGLSGFEPCRCADSGTDFDAGTGTTVASATVGPAGGELRAQGISLRFPAGAVRAPTDFVVRRLTDMVPEGALMAYEIEPSGTVFDAPVTLEVNDLPPMGSSEEVYDLALREGDSWVPLVESHSVLGSDSLRGTLVHLSTYGVVRRRPGEVGERGCFCDAEWLRVYRSCCGVTSNPPVSGSPPLCFGPCRVGAARSVSDIRAQWNSFTENWRATNCFFERNELNPDPLPETPFHRCARSCCNSTRDLGLARCVPQVWSGGNFFSVVILEQGDRERYEACLANCPARTPPPCCGPTTCPDGCCDANGLCQSSGDNACGIGGVACANCGARGEVCIAGGTCCNPGTDPRCRRACDATTCPNGCCDTNGQCQPSGNSSCGIGGAACADCGARGEICIAEGTCCNPESDPRCRPACNAATCPNGCCDDTGTCQKGRDAAACGNGGAACRRCANTCGNRGSCCPPAPGASCGSTPCQAFRGEDGCPATPCCDSRNNCGYIDRVGRCFIP